jgi:hypothetical protein
LGLIVYATHALSIVELFGLRVKQFERDMIVSKGFKFARNSHQFKSIRNSHSAEIKAESYAEVPIRYVLSANMSKDSFKFNKWNFRHIIEIFTLYMEFIDTLGQFVFAFAYLIIGTSAAGICIGWNVSIYFSMVFGIVIIALFTYPLIVLCYMGTVIERQVKF